MGNGRTDIHSSCLFCLVRRQRNIIVTREAFYGNSQFLRHHAMWSVGAGSECRGIATSPVTQRTTVTIATLDNGLHQPTPDSRQTTTSPTGEVSATIVRLRSRVGK